MLGTWTLDLPPFVLREEGLKSKIDLHQHRYINFNHLFNTIACKKKSNNDNVNTIINTISGLIKSTFVRIYWVWMIREALVPKH